MKKSCATCDHCTPRHIKGGLGALGDCVCLVLANLIPDSETEGTLCDGACYDPKGSEQHDEWLSVPEAAEILGVHRNRVLQLVNDGALDGHKVGQRWNVSRASVESRAANPPKPGRRW